MIMRQINGCIDELESRYNTKMEGYTTLMSYMSELGKIIGEDNINNNTQYTNRILFKSKHLPLTKI
ncbi:MAG: hypothetical protein QXH07_01435 [Thermoplasmata archaeon]